MQISGRGGGGGGGGGLITIFTSGGVVWVMAVTVTFIRSTPAVNIKYLATWLICSVATPTLEKTFLSRLVIAWFHEVTGCVHRESS